MGFSFWSGWTRAIHAVPIVTTLHLAPIASKDSTVPPPEIPQNITRQKRFGYQGPHKIQHTSLADLQSFEATELSGRPLFTRELFNKVIKLQESAGLPEDSRLVWLRSYFMAVKGRINGTPIDGVSGVRVFPPFKYERPNPLHVEQLHEEVQHLQEQWAQSQMCLDLQRLLHDCAHRMPRIDKIICFGLGAPSRSHGHSYPAPFDSDEVNFTLRRSMILQHLATTTISTTLQNIYNTKPIPILSQDPAYTSVDKTILSNLSPPIGTIEDPRGFLAIDKNTLVFHYACPAPVDEICADLAVESDGPAAILGTEIDPDINMRAVYVHEWATPRVVKFFKDYAIRDFDDFEVPTQEWEALWTGPAPPFLWRMQFRHKRIKAEEQ